MNRLLPRISGMEARTPDAPPWSPRSAAGPTFAGILLREECIEAGGRGACSRNAAAVVTLLSTRRRRHWAVRRAIPAHGHHRALDCARANRFRVAIGLVRRRCMRDPIATNSVSTAERELTYGADRRDGNAQSILPGGQEDLPLFEPAVGDQGTRRRPPERNHPTCPRVIRRAFKMRRKSNRGAAPQRQVLGEFLQAMPSRWVPDPELCARTTTPHIQLRTSQDRDRLARRRRMLREMS